MPTMITSEQLKGTAGQTSSRAALSSNKPAERKFTGLHMLGIMVGFFGIIIAVNFYMAFKAAGTWTGMIVKNSYVASQEFNEKLDKLAAQQALGWTGALGYRDEGVELKIVDGEGDAVSLQNVTVLVGRPSFEQKDQVFPMHEIAAGHYRAAIELDAGPWMLTVTADAGEADYRLETRIFVNDAGDEIRP